MQAKLNGQVIARSEDIRTHDGYVYFPPDAVRMDLLQAAPKSASDLQCPHGVQFYDVVLDGARHARVAWSYESPRPALQEIAHRIGFWKDVELA